MSTTPLTDEARLLQLVERSVPEPASGISFQRDLYDLMALPKFPHNDERKRDLLLLSLSTLVYYDLSERSEWSLWGWTLRFYKSQREFTQFMTLRRDSVLIVVFRGTELINSPNGAILHQMIGDWRVNFQCGMTPSDAPPSQPRVHSGFWRELTEPRAGGDNTISDLVLHTLLTDPPQDIYFTGHSLGGALATLMCYRAMLRLCPAPAASSAAAAAAGSPRLDPLPSLSGDAAVGTPPLFRFRALVTFGAPNVGNQAFKRDFLQRYQAFTGTRAPVCWVRERDPVPRVPSHDYEFHYYHVLPALWDFVTRYIRRSPVEAYASLDRSWLPAQHSEPWVLFNVFQHYPLKSSVLGDGYRPLLAARL